MPEKQTVEKAKRARRKGKAPSTQAGRSPRDVGFTHTANARILSSAGRRLDGGAGAVRCSSKSTAGRHSNRISRCRSRANGH